MAKETTLKTENLARKVFWRFIFITAGLLALHLFFQWLNLHYHEKQGQVFEISNRVDFDDELSLPTWFAQFILLAIAGTAWLAARFDEGRRRRAWRLVSLIGLIFAIDEVAGIHEFVLQSAHLVYYGEVVPTAALNAWWLMLPFIGAAGLWLVWWLSRTLPVRTIRLFVIAGVVYLIGAAGVELMSNDVAKTTFLYQGIMTGLEEVLELVGSTIALYTVLDYLQRHQAAKLAALRQLLTGKS